MDILVSVVIPVYNVEKYLDRCVESIINQTYSNLEIILVDDGSADNSSDMCEQWAKKDSRVKVIHKENAGAGLARNTGIENATGKYIFFVDSDDYMDVTTVEKCISKALNSGADIVMFGRCDVFKDGTKKIKPVNSKELDFEKEAVLNDILPGLFTYDRGFGISVWGKMFNLDVIKSNKIQFESERKIISEDAYFLLALFNRISKITVLPENLYFYYKNENSFSRKYKKGHQELNDNFLQKSIRLCENLKYPEKLKLYITARYHTYSLVGMKLIIASDLSRKEKKAELKAVFENGILHASLKDDAIKLAIPPSKIFWKLFRIRLYYLCYLLLWYKAHKQKV